MTKLSSLGNKRRISELVEEQLVEKILNGEIEEGSRLPSEKRIMEMTGVGRVGVREAIASLRWKGFLEVNQGELPKVVRPKAPDVIDQLSVVAKSALSDPDGLSQFNHARVVFELGVVQQVCRHGTREQFNMLRKVHAENDDLVNDRNAFANGDIKFHRTLAEATHNPILVATHRAIVDWLIGARVAPWQSDPLAVQKEHEAILTALEKRDVVAAQDEMELHLRRTL